MEQTLRVTNVLSDPTRYSIYQYLIMYRKDVNVMEIAEKFDIHPNVARMHLSKLEDIHLVRSHAKKTGKGGRPGRVYSLSDELIELNFPSRDYKTLASIAIESMAALGEPGRQALYETGKKYGNEVIMGELKTKAEPSMQEKINILEDAGKMLGLYSSFTYNEEEHSISFNINNCPFKEIAASNNIMVCNMHSSFLKGMFEALFDNIQLKEETNMFTQDCSHCSYRVNLTIV